MGRSETTNGDAGEDSKRSCEGRYRRTGNSAPDGAVQNRFHPCPTANVIQTISNGRRGYSSEMFHTSDNVTPRVLC